MSEYDDVEACEQAATELSTLVPVTAQDLSRYLRSLLSAIRRDGTLDRLQRSIDDACVSDSNTLALIHPRCDAK